MSLAIDVGAGRWTDSLYALREQGRLKGIPYIFCVAIPGKPLAYLDAMWRQVGAETGFHDLRIHDLRRTVGSWLVTDGDPLHLVGAVLNHKDQKTTTGYAFESIEAPVARLPLPTAL